jgi:hypothetical protein
MLTYVNGLKLHCIYKHVSHVEKKNVNIDMQWHNYSVNSLNQNWDSWHSSR